MLHGVTTNKHVPLTYSVKDGRERGYVQVQVTVCAKAALTDKIFLHRPDEIMNILGWNCGTLSRKKRNDNL